MVKKKKTTIRLSKKSLRKLVKVIIVLFFVLLVSYGFYLLIDSYRLKKWAETVVERNLYCNTTWQDYINEEVVLQMTEYNATDCKCFYENHYTMDKLASICICSCMLYDLNGTLITDDFRPLFSAIK
ncbi:MAG: hypothetical protein WC376_02865 [Candidatus Nanoarchaeia archaeon]|jgi:hypothetical protein